MVENVVLITVDSLRADQLSIGDDTGYPGLAANELAEEGVSFERAFATGPGTGPSFPGLLSGTLPLSYDGLGPLSSKRPRLSVHLSEHGLATAGFHSNPFLSSFFNYDVGFDEFTDYQNPLMGLTTKLFPRGIELSNPTFRRIDEMLRLTDTLKKTYQLIQGKPRPYVNADVITEDAIAWLAEADSPFFCWAHYMDVHHPCYPPKEYRSQFGVGPVTHGQVAEWYSQAIREYDSLPAGRLNILNRLYQAAIAYTDDQIRRLLEHLDRSGDYDDTLIVYTSDHGELHGEHGAFGKPPCLSDELLHVPLIVVNGPDRLSTTSDELVSLLDVPPLIHDALDIDLPDTYEGRLLGADDPRTRVIAEHEVEGNVIIGARSKSWRYEVDQHRNEQRLYEIRDGRAQSVPFDGQAEPAMLRAAVLDRLDEIALEIGQLPDEMTADVEARLEHLGYL